MNTKKIISTIALSSYFTASSLPICKTNQCKENMNLYVQMVDETVTNMNNLRNVNVIPFSMNSAVTASGTASNVLTYYPFVQNLS